MGGMVPANELVSSENLRSTSTREWEGYKMIADNAMSVSRDLYCNWALLPSYKFDNNCCLVFGCLGWFSTEDHSE